MLAPFDVTVECLQPLSWPSLVLLLLTGGALAFYYQDLKEKKRTSSKYTYCIDVGQTWSRSASYVDSTTVTSTGKAALGGPWCLIDSEGNVVSDADFRCVGCDSIC